MTAFAQQLVYGASYGMNLAVAAAGLALIFGVYRVINLAHGQLIMLGGFVAYVVATQLGTHFFVGFFTAMIVMGLLSIVLENAVFRFLQRPPAHRPASGLARPLHGSRHHGAPYLGRLRGAADRHAG